MATKPFVTVYLYLHDRGEDTTGIADYIDDNGKFINIGTQTAAMIERREAVHFQEGDDEIIIPFHAISGVVITKADDEYTKPDDDFCQPPCPEVGCNVSYTVTWMNGETKLGEQVYDYGATPSYNGTPTGEECKEFAGWATTAGGEPLDTLPPVTDTTTYYAVFYDAVYEITWMNGDTELGTDDVDCGDTPEYTGEEPVGDGDFVGWNTTPNAEEALEEIPPATSDATYYAVFMAK